MVTIEPIRNQYLTALKERQHIIDKLNEIIVGLNALDFDDLTTIHTKLTEIETEVNNVKSNLDSQLEQIEQIESELTSHDNRITANASKNTDIENHLNSFESDTEINLNTKVNKSGDTMTGNLSIPTTSTGVRDKNAVNGERLGNDLDNYAPMVRTTGKQKINALKQFMDKLLSSWTINNEGTYYHEYMRFSAEDENIPIITVVGAQDSNADDFNTVAQLNVYHKGQTTDYSRLFLTHTPNGTLLQLRRYKNNAIVNTITLGQINDG